MMATFRLRNQNAVTCLLKRKPNDVMWLDLDWHCISFDTGVNGLPFAAIKRNMISGYKFALSSQTLLAYKNSKRKAIESLVPMCETVLVTHKLLEM